MTSGSPPTWSEMLARDIAAGRRDLPAVVCSSRLDPKKNHIGLVHAFAQSARPAGRGQPAHRRARRGGYPQPRGTDRPERAVLDEIVAVCEATRSVGQGQRLFPGQPAASWPPPTAT